MTAANFKIYQSGIDFKTSTENQFQFESEAQTKMASKDYYAYRRIFYLHYDRLEFCLSKDFSRFEKDVPGLMIQSGDLIYKVNGKLKFR